MSLHVLRASRSHGRRVRGFGQNAAAAYRAKILSYSPIAYWPLNETSGVVVVNLVNAAMNGTYSGPTLANAAGPGGLDVCPLFDGNNDFANVYSAALNAAFNGAECTIMAWLKVSAAGVWADGIQRFPWRFLNASNHRYDFSKLTNVNLMQAQYRVGAASKDINLATSNAAWFHATLTVSQAADQFKLFINGAQSGLTQTGLGTWSGALSATGCCIGAFSSAAAFPWSGWLAHQAIFASALAPTAILDIATI